MQILSEPSDTKMEKRPLHSYGTSGACCIEILVDEIFSYRNRNFGCSITRDTHETVHHNSFPLSSQAKGGVFKAYPFGHEDYSIYDATHVYGCGGFRSFMDKYWVELSINEYENGDEDDEDF